MTDIQHGTENSTSSNGISMFKDLKVMYMHALHIFTPQHTPFEKGYRELGTFHLMSREPGSISVSVGMKVNPTVLQKNKTKAIWYL